MLGPGPSEAAGWGPSPSHVTESGPPRTTAGPKRPLPGAPQSGAFPHACCLLSLGAPAAGKEIRVPGGRQPPLGHAACRGPLPRPELHGGGPTSLGWLLAVAQLPADILQPPLQLLLLLLSQLLLRLGRLLLPARGCGRAGRCGCGQGRRMPSPPRRCPCPPGWSPCHRKSSGTVTELLRWD